MHTRGLDGTNTSVLERLDPLALGLKRIDLPPHPEDRVSDDIAGPAPSFGHQPSGELPVNPMSQSSGSTTAIMNTWPMANTGPATDTDDRTLQLPAGPRPKLPAKLAPAHNEAPETRVAKLRRERHSARVAFIRNVLLTMALLGAIFYLGKPIDGTAALYHVLSTPATKLPQHVDPLTMTFIVMSLEFICLFRPIHSLAYQLTTIRELQVRWVSLPATVLAVCTLSGFAAWVIPIIFSP